MKNMITVENYKKMTQEIIDGSLSSYIEIELENVPAGTETFSYGDVFGLALDYETKVYILWVETVYFNNYHWQGDVEEVEEEHMEIFEELKDFYQGNR